MGLTLNSLSLSSGSGSGLTEEDVKDLIEYEYITRVPVTSAAVLSVTDSIDSTLYDGFKFSLINLRLSTAGSMTFKILDSSGTAYTKNAYTTIFQSTSRSYGNISTFTSTTIQLTSSITTDAYGEIQVDCRHDSTISGRYSMNYFTNTNGFSHGSFTASPASTFGGIELVTSSGTFNEQGEVRVYGRKKRS